MDVLGTIASFSQTSFNALQYVRWTGSGSLTIPKSKFIIVFPNSNIYEGGTIASPGPVLATPGMDFYIFGKGVAKHAIFDITGTIVKHDQGNTEDVSIAYCPF